MNDIHNKGKISNGFITGITEDHLGFIWIATIWGLNRYNPVNGDVITIYSKYSESILCKIALQNPTVIPANFSVKFKKIKNERGYFLRSDIYGMCYNEYGFVKAIEIIDFISKKAANTQVDCIIDNKIRALESDEKGNVWIGYEYGGISKIDCQSLKFTHFLSDVSRTVKKNNVFCLLPLKDKVYIGNQNGELEIVDIYSGKYSRVLSEIGNINQIKKFNDTSIWIASQNNVLVLSTKNNRVKAFSDLFPAYKSVAVQGVMSLLTDNQENKWIGTLNKGFILINQHKGFHVYNNTNALVDNEVRSIYMDSFDRLWVSYLNPMVEVFDHHFNKIKTLGKAKNDDFKGSVIFNFFENERGTMYIAGLETGLQEYSIDKNVFAHQKLVMDGPTQIPLNNLTKIVKSTN